jgi:hypothetical protein
VDEHPQDHDRAVVLLRDEGHGRRGHDVRDRRELLRSRIGRGDEARDRLGGRRQDEQPARDGVDRVEPVPEPRDDPEVAAAAADRPEQVRVRVGVGAHELAVRGHDVGREQVVDREPVLAHEVADAAAEGEAADADRSGVAEADAEPVLRGRDGDLAGRGARLGPGRP